MTDPNFKVSFDFEGAMRQLGRLTRRGIDTVKQAGEEPDEESERPRGAAHAAPKDRDTP